MIEVKQLEFFSKVCKNDKHSECFSSWEGLGFLVTCYCVCHKQKQRALAEVRGPETNATVSLTQEPTQDDD